MSLLPSNEVNRDSGLFVILVVADLHACMIYNLSETLFHSFYVLQLLLIVPFMRFGELILRADAVDVIPKHFSDLFHPGEALKGLGHAVLGWLIICAVLSWPVAYGLTPVFAFLRRKYVFPAS